MTRPIRLSPSGPVIANADGGPFAPGPGCRLRLVQAECTLSQTSIQIPTIPTGIGPTLGTVILTPHLDAPDVALRYTASVRCDVSNPATTTGTVQLFLDTSTDAITWTNAAQNDHLLSGGANANNGCRQVSLSLVLTDGASLGVTSSPASPQLYVRARISCTQAGGTPLNMLLNSAGPGTGTIMLELEETL